MLEPRGGRFVTGVLTEVVLGARSVVYVWMECSMVRCVVVDNGRSWAAVVRATVRW